jgi:hypothetical protein
MISFKEYLEEKYTNLLPGDEAEKRKHAPAVFNMLKKSYSKIGGIKGTGFNSPADMVKNVAMWKLHHNNKGELTHAVLYKDKTGRKAVALGTNGTQEGKAKLTNTLGHELKRSHMEMSGPTLAFYKNTIGPVKPLAHTRAQVKLLHPGEEIRKPPHDDPEVQAHPELKHHLYQRKIGDDWHTKVSVGTPGRTITPK